MLAFGAHPHRLNDNGMTPEQLLDNSSAAQQIRALFEYHHPIGTLKAQAARAYIKNHSDIENELVPRKCKEYVTTNAWMNDFFEAGLRE